MSKSESENKAPDSKEETDYQKFREDIERAELKGRTPARDEASAEGEPLPLGEQEADNYLRNAKDINFVTDDERGDQE